MEFVYEAIVVVISLPLSRFISQYSQVFLARPVAVNFFGDKHTLRTNNIRFCLQETRVCERIDEVDCSKSEQFYNLNLELYGNTQTPILEGKVKCIMQIVDSKEEKIVTKYCK